MLFEYLQFALVFVFVQMCFGALTVYVMFKFIFSDKLIKWYAKKIMKMTKELENTMYEYEEEESN